MKYRELGVAGCFEVLQAPMSDDRGWFSRIFCTSEFEDHDLETRVVQINNSLSFSRATLRGLHYQIGESAETKLIRAISGSVFDVCLDLRSESPTFRRWSAVEVSAKKRNMLYVPRGCAHGILTLEPDTELMYLVSASYEPKAERGIRWDDPAFCIEWPMAPLFISDKDANWPLWNPPHLRSEDGPQGL